MSFVKFLLEGDSKLKLRANQQHFNKYCASYVIYIFINYIKYFVVCPRNIEQ